MRMVTTAELKTHANQLLGQVTAQKRPIVITRHGKPCAVIEPFAEGDIEDLAFEYGREVQKMAKTSVRDMKAGRYTTMKDFAKKHGLT